MDKLQLNGASLIFEPETSQALGFGSIYGFLGMLYLELIQERLEREFNQAVIKTVPNVSFVAYKTNGEKHIIDTPTEMLDPAKVDHIEEPFIEAQIITILYFIGSLIMFEVKRALASPAIPDCHTGSHRRKGSSA